MANSDQTDFSSPRNHEPKQNLESLECIRLEVARALRMISKGQRLDAHELLEICIKKLEPLGVTEDYLKAKSFFSDFLDDMDYPEQAAEKRSECIELSTNKFGENSHFSASLMIKQAKTFFVLLSKTEEKNQILKFSWETFRMTRRALKVLQILDDYPNKSQIIEDLRQKLLFSELLIRNLQVMNRNAKISC